MFGRKNKQSSWKVDFYDSVYKIYDKGGNLAGYFFPHYPKVQADRDSETLKMAKSHSIVSGGSLMLPLVRLDLPDVEEGQDLEELIGNFSSSIDRVKEWKKWFQSNTAKYHIQGYQVYTAREDKQMLSIVLYLDSRFALGTKEVLNFLEPILGDLSENGMI